MIWTVCRNVLVTCWRREEVRLSVDAEVASSLAAQIAGPEDRVLQGGDWVLCCQALWPLPSRLKQVVYLRGIMELDYADIATRLGITVAAAVVAYHRGMAKLIASHRGERRPR
jgi:DNA-directed RNA polymerase specialized sigma24 family protein